MNEINEIIIVGGGPVGSYTSVLMSLLGLKVTVYEKRNSYRREINVKISPGFFSQTQNVLNKIGIKNDNFFSEIDQNLNSKNNRILIKDLENLFKEKSLSLGAKFIIEEITSFREVHKRHHDTNPLILDCTGRHSKLRVSEFGDDKANMNITLLESAVHINFRAIFDSVYKSILYSSMKNNENIKLSEIVASRKLATADGYKNVTVPIFISEKLAQIFDEEYPNINRDPLFPFKTNDKNKYIHDEIFSLISSILAPLIMEGWKIDFQSIMVKKIEITCGYSLLRSFSHYICLGDSAVHLAYYKSLNFGLKHSLDFFKMLSGIRTLNKRIDCLEWINSFVLDEFRKQHPTLNPIYVRQTNDLNTYFVVTKIIFYGAYKFNLVTLETEHLTDNLGVKESELEGILLNLNKNLKNWDNLLSCFEKKRQSDINNVIDNNLRKKKMFDYISDFVWLNSKSPLKLSELINKISKGYALYAEDNQFIKNCFLILKDFMVLNENLYSSSEDLMSNEIERLLDSYEASFFTKDKSQKNDLIKSLKNIFDHTDEKCFYDKVEAARGSIKEKNLSLNDGDIKFIFIIKILDIVIDYILIRKEKF